MDRSARRKASSFAQLSKVDRKLLIKEAATIAIMEGLDYLEATQRVAIQQQLVHIQHHEKAAVKQAVYRAAKSLRVLEHMGLEQPIDGACNHRNGRRRGCK